MVRRGDRGTDGPAAGRAGGTGERRLAAGPEIRRRADAAVPLPLRRESVVVGRARLQPAAGRARRAADPRRPRAPGAPGRDAEGRIEEGISLLTSIRLRIYCSILMAPRL